MSASNDPSNDLKAAGIECGEARDFAKCAENIETFPCDECSLHDPNGSPQCVDRLVAALARIAIGLSGELAAAKAHWDAAARMAREAQAERDRARKLAVGLENECARLRGMIAQGEAEA